MAGKTKKNKKVNSKFAFLHLLRKYFFKILITLGFFIFLVSIFTKIYFLSNLSFSSAYPQTKISKGILPSTIYINSQKIELSIYPTQIRSGIWEINENGASYLKNSGNLSDSLPIIIYAHNTNNRFGKILNLKKNDSIEVVGKDNKIYKYKITEISVVDPTNINILTKNPKNTLILYTCTGFADSKRFVVKSTLIPS